MFYSIDLTGLRFLHKAPTFETVAGLVHIEASDCDVLVTSFNSPGSLQGFTIFELKKLYLNSTGRELTTYDEAVARKTLDAVAQALPVTDCKAQEVLRQLEAIAFKDKAKYQYVKGATRPATRFGALAHLAVSGEVTEPVYGPDTPVVIESSKPTEREDSKEGKLILKKPKIRFEKPTEGIALEIWNLLDAREDLRDGMRIQAEAIQRGWNTLTAIVQLSNWKKFNFGG
jgi:hypothetical protein